MEQKVIIKASITKILKKHFILLLLGTPILIMVFGEDPKSKKSDQVNEIFTWIYFVYISVILIRLVFMLIKHQSLELLKLEPKGITVLGKQLYPWDSIYDCRIVTKVTKIYTGKYYAPELGEQKFFVINDDYYNFTWQQSKFSLEELLEILIVYKERNSFVKIE